MPRLRGWYMTDITPVMSWFFDHDIYSTLSVIGPQDQCFLRANACWVEFLGYISLMRMFMLNWRINQVGYLGRAVGSLEVKTILYFQNILPFYKLDHLRVISIDWQTPYCSRHIYKMVIASQLNKRGRLFIPTARFWKCYKSGNFRLEKI